MALKHVAAPLISGALFGSFLHRLAVCRVIRCECDRYVACFFDHYVSY